MCTMCVTSGEVGEMCITGFELSIKISSLDSLVLNLGLLAQYPLQLLCFLNGLDLS